MLEGTGRIFGLDSQLLFDLLFQGIAVFLLFLFVGYLLINPVRQMLEKRQEKVQSDLANAAKDKEEAALLKEQYDEKLKSVGEEAALILSEAHTKAVKNEAAIIAEAKEEAGRIRLNAENDARLEKLKVQDEVRTEIINVASAMAGKIVEEKMDQQKQNELLDETLKEIGDDTWREK
ncbi:MAG: F0F1 ATP synthase subunit B [Eubacterium sp.]|nr:F0F1 ATP synthase subunit B [Eubacterium sp.]